MGSRGSSCITAFRIVAASLPSQLIKPAAVCAATDAAGKLASAITIVSPCPMRASAYNNCGGKTRGIPFKIVMVSNNDSAQTGRSDSRTHRIGNESSDPKTLQPVM